tara:strand:- start:84 stop:272 length:189 start_codon:yes stop_codon:yes gene_type:complete
MNSNKFKNTKSSDIYHGSGELVKTKFNQRNISFRNKMDAIVKLKEKKLFKTGILTGGNRKKN